MTHDQNPIKPDADLPPGYTEVTGPAAFRAQQRAGDDTAAPDLSAATGSASSDPADVGPALIQKVIELEAKLADANDQYLRTVADMDNLRKRSAREREDASKYAVASFARDLLDVSDTFRRALDAIPPELRADERVRPFVEGIEATERALLKSFEKNGIKKIEPMDQLFDPHFHEVMFEAPVPGKEAGMIIQLLEAGYVLHDRLLRPARVGVAKANPADTPVHNLDTQA